MEIWFVSSDKGERQIYLHNKGLWQKDCKGEGARSSEEINVNKE